MISVLKPLRACRSMSTLTKSFEQFSYFLKPNQFRRLIEEPYLTCQLEVRQIRSSSTAVNHNQDPLSDCDSIYPLNKVQIEELTGNDPKEVRKLKILQMELAVKSVQSPEVMPEKIKLEQWRNLLSLSRSAQTKYLITVKKKERRLTGKVVPERNYDPAEFDPWEHEHQVFQHRLFRNAMFSMLHPNTMSGAMNSRLASAIQFSPPLIVDCGYESVMSVREIKNLCQQLALCINLNRTARNSYNMVFCNLKPNTVMSETMWAAVPNISEDHMPILTTESCYTELYPKEKLVYLTPHCRESVDFNHDDIYIIGAMVDKSNPGPHSLIKAKAQGLRMGSFPLDRYLVWKKGTKSLTIDQVFTVLSKMLLTRDWSQSFSAIPKRKIADVMAFGGVNRRQRKFEF